MGKRSYVADEDKNLEIRGYRLSYIKVLLTTLGILLSCGVFWMFLSWKKTLFMQCTHMSCPMEEAEKVLIVDCHGQQFVSKIQRSSSEHRIPFFYYKGLKYNWNENQCKFVNMRGLDIITCSDLLKCERGLNFEQVSTKRDIYGPNSIDIQVKPILTLFLREIKNPFYLYQAFCVMVWCFQFYYQFAVSMVLLSIISVSATVWETRKQSKTLRDAMQLKSVATVLREGKETEIDSEELCPGDVIVLSASSFTMHCDAVLLNGTCVVNESMLTGESTPITKVPLSGDLDTVFNPVSHHKRSVLSCGTEVLLSRSVGNSRVKAIVYRTGFSTAKGELVRAILYPKPVKLRLYSDFLKCSSVCFILGILPLIYTGLVGVKLGAFPFDVVLFTLNVVTFFFPPALPAVLTSINEQAQRRLRKQGIYCLNTRYIHFAGGLDVVCFDKTGTLTEDSLDILAAVPVQEGKFERAVENIGNLPSDLLLTAMASCHSLSRINEDLLGYDLDIKMFKATGWELQEPTSEIDRSSEFRPPRIVCPNNAQDRNLPSVGILKQFPFESVLRRTSVVTFSEGVFRTFVKGAPEQVVTFCKTGTVPHNTKEMIDYYSSRGYRIIGLATTLLEQCTSPNQALDLSREELETDMQFLGLVILENKLKTETIPALNLLKEANIKSVMVTGDNLLTAITVGRKCGIVDQTDSLVIMEAILLPPSKEELSKIQLKVSYKMTESQSPYQTDVVISNGRKAENSIVRLESKCRIAIEGATFNTLRAHAIDLLEKVVVKGAIFARMLPEDKLFLIEHFQNLGYQVGMCGDGANDCGALKTAHTGVSLSVAEASVAAPFTSKYTDIRCMSTLIREGRATLVSTFDSFKYMMCYTLTFLLAVLFLFWDGQRPSDGAYIFIDMILNLAPPFLIGATSAYTGLAKKPPPRSILSFVPIFSVFSFLTIQVGMHLIAYIYCKGQPWYEPFTFDRENALSPESSYSGTTLLSINMMAYVAAATAYPTGPPYRNGFFSNKKFVGLLAIEFFVIACLVMYPPDFMISFLNLKRAPNLEFHLNLYAISIGGFIFFIIYERYFVQRFLSQYVVPSFNKRRNPVKKYEKLQVKLRDWPSMEDLNTDSVQKDTLHEVGILNATNGTLNVGYTNCI